MKFNLPVAILAAAAVVSLPAAAANEWAVQDLVESWATALHRPVKWEAGDFTQGRKVRLKQEVKPANMADFERAFNSLNDLIAQAPAPTPLPLVACVFDNVVVIRTAAQPPCGKPLTSK